MRRHLGPKQRAYTWRDHQGWTFKYDQDTFWKIYRPDGTHADDMIEAALNEGEYGPFFKISTP